MHLVDLPHMGRSPAGAEVLVHELIHVTKKVLEGVLFRFPHFPISLCFLKAADSDSGHLCSTLLQ